MNFFIIEKSKLKLIAFINITNIALIPCLSQVINYLTFSIAIVCYKEKAQ